MQREMIGETIRKFLSLIHISQDLDWGFIAENIDAWVEKAELEFIQ